MSDAKLNPGQCGTCGVTAAVRYAADDCADCMEARHERVNRAMQDQAHQDAVTVREMAGEFSEVLARATSDGVTERIYGDRRADRDAHEFVDGSWS